MAQFAQDSEGNITHKLVNNEWVPISEVQLEPSEAIAAPPKELPSFGEILSEQLPSGIKEGLFRMTAGPLLGIGMGDRGTAETLLQGLGVTSPQPTTGTGQLIRRTGQELGGAAIPSAAVASRAASPVSALLAELGLAGTGGMAAGLTEQAGGGQGAQLAAQVGVPLGITGLTTGVQAGLRGLLRGRSGEPARQTIEQFQQAGVSPSLGQATGGRATQALETIISKGPGGGSPFFRAGMAQQEGLEQTVKKIAEDISPRRGAEIAGQTIKKGILEPGGFVSRFKEKANQAYNKVAELIPPGTTIGAGKTMTLLDELAEPIPGAAAASESSLVRSSTIADFRERLSQDLAEGEGFLPYDTLKKLRSRLGSLLASPQVIDDAPRAELKRLYAAMSDDLFEAAKNVGAEKAARRADNFWKAGMGRIDDTISSVVKKVNPEDVFLAATRGKEGATTVRRIMRSLKPEERNVVAATFLTRLGRAKGGQLGEFSSESFLTNWRNLDKGARKAIFGGSEKLNHYNRDINNLAKVMERVRESSRALANPSGTGSLTANIATLSSGATGLFLGEPSIAAGAALITLSNRSAANLLTKPNVVNWVARTTKMPVDRIMATGARVMSGQDEETQAAIQEYIDNVRNQSGQ